MLMLLMPVALMAQTTDMGTTTATEAYCVLKIQGKVFSGRVNVVADFGQEQTVFVKRLKDEAGKVVDLHSVADALNYMAQRGWQFVQAYTTTRDTDPVHYILKKKLP
jgi:hypothetical protein